MIWNLPTLIGVLLIVLVLFLIFRNQFIRKKQGKGGCGCGCSSCANSAYCHPASKENTKQAHGAE